jgi:hypothetical protein
VLSDIGGQAALTNPITGTGTTNYLPKFTGASTLGNSQIFDNGTNVGIGTTSPLTALTVSGNLSLFTTNQIRLYNSAKNNWTQVDSPLLSGDTEVDFRVVTKTGTFYINASGNVGIGTTSPAANLEVYAGSATLRISDVGSASAIGEVSSTLEFWASDPSVASGSNASRVRASLNTIFETATGSLNSLAFNVNDGTATGLPERMRILSNGNVGIGTSSPSARLHTSLTTNGTSVGALFANPNQSGTADAVSINFGLGRTVDSFLFSIPAITYGKEQQWTSTGSTVDGYLSFATTLNETTSERMRITSGGNVGIGTTSPTRTLHVLGQTGIGTVLKLEGATGTTTYLQLSYNGATNAQSGYIGYDSSSNMSLFTNDTERMRIFSSGNVFIGSSPSDAGFRLEVNGSTRITGGAEMFYLRNSTTNAMQGRIGVRNDGAMQIYSFQSGVGYRNILLGVDATTTNAGNVGIGTTSPDSKLTSLGNIKLGNALDNSSQWIGKSSSGTENFRGAIKFSSTTTDDIIQFNTHRSGVSSDIRMTIDGIGNVGIGTTSPIGPLTVAALGNADTIFLLGRSADNATRIDFYNNARSARLYTVASGNGAIEHYADANVPMVFSTNGSERLRIFANGNIGVNTGSTDNGYKLNVNGSTRLGGGDFGTSQVLSIAPGVVGIDAPGVANGRFVVNGIGSVGIGTPSPEVRLDVLGAGTVQSRVQSTSGGDIRFSVDTVGRFGTYSASDLLILTSGAERMRIFSSGNVFIGASPSDAGFRLDVAGTGRVIGSLTINSATTPFLYFHSARTSGQSGYIKDDGNMVFQKTESGGGFRFLNSSSSVLLSIDSVGNSAFSNSVTITPPSNQVGLTVNHSGTNGAEGSKFNSAGSGLTYGANTVTIDTCNYGSGLKIVTNLWAASQQAVQFTSNTTTVGSITCNSTSTAYNTSSDYRLKENVIPIHSAIDRLNALNPCRFNFINEPTKIVDGFIAHEVQEVIPEAVTGEKDELDYDGSPKYQGIDQSKLVPLLTAALQEAIEKIKLLENRLLILENK